MGTRVTTHSPGDALVVFQLSWFAAVLDAQLPSMQPTAVPISLP
jgi:hypothetical protein